MTDHSHVMGGSTATRRIHCPGSYKYESQVPDKGSSEDADRGSMLHAAMELLLNEDPRNVKEAQPLLNQLEGQDMGFEGHEITADLIATKLSPALYAWWEIDKEYEIEEIFIEQKVSLQTILPGAFGTADVIGRDKDKRLHVIDWKFGDGVSVPVENNLGAGFYAAGVLYDEEEPELNEFCQTLPPADEPLEVVLHIIQPRAGYDQYRFTWETDDRWIDSVVAMIQEAGEKMQLEEPPLATGDWCRFCSAKVFCPEYQQLTVATQAKEPEGMTSIELADYLTKADLLKGWIRALWNYAESQAEQGVQIPGFKLVQGRAGNRKFRDEAEAEAICKKSRVKADVMYDKKLKSPTQLENLAPNVYKKKLAKLVERPKGKLTLVPDTDPRPAVEGSMQLLGAELAKIQETGNSKDD